MNRNPLLEHPDPQTRARRIAGGLFFLTCCSVFFVRVAAWEEGSGWTDTDALWRALAFTSTLMAILLGHELGHYAVARHHGFRLSLPWFIPAPFLVGTLGAIIRLEEQPRTRAGLLEMGAAGPLVGLVVAGVAMVWRLLVGGDPAGVTVSSPLLWKGLSLAVTGQVVPMTTGDPVAFAAWLGCLLTAMNLLPFGQLDGGHVLAALLPRQAILLGWVTTACLLVGGLYWPGWAVWAVVLHLLGTRFPVEPRRDNGFPHGRPVLVTLLVVLAFGLSFTAVPITGIPGAPTP